MQKVWQEQLDTWVSMAYDESNSRQQDINKFFNELSQTELLNKSDQMMFEFCKVLFQKSISKAFFLDSGEKRPSDRLDYRYIDCTIKLIVVLMKT
mmetsp:Transcript_48325/g.35514  ORF Transcript_48325/g.35514 Transcript_48325/m.35514 type:complete len:95 (+) Transcript_48325:473-757(+)